MYKADDWRELLVVLFANHTVHLMLTIVEGQSLRDSRISWFDMRNKLTDKNLRALYNTEQELIMELTRFFFYGVLP